MRCYVSASNRNVFRRFLNVARNKSVDDSSCGHPPGGRLPLLSARPAVTFLDAEHHRPLAGTNEQKLATSILRPMYKLCVKTEEFY